MILIQAERATMIKQTVRQVTLSIHGPGCVPLIAHCLTLHLALTYPKDPGASDIVHLDLDCFLLRLDAQVLGSTVVGHMPVAHRIGVAAATTSSTPGVAGLHLAKLSLSRS